MRQFQIAASLEVEKPAKSRKFGLTDRGGAWLGFGRTRSDPKGVTHMAGTVTGSLVQQFASMKPTEFGPTIEPKWQVAERLMKEIRGAVEKQQLTPLDGARVISSITATLFGYDEFILREVSPESLLATSARR